MDGINPGDEKLIFEPAEVGSTRTFANLGLQEELLRGIDAYRSERPSAIQQRMILSII